MSQHRLSKPAVLTAAREILDSDGLGGLSMRRVTPTQDSTGHPDVYPRNSRGPGQRPDHHPEQPVAPVPAPAREQHLPDSRPAPAAKTSSATVFGLVFGLAALFCAFTAILSPAAVLFGIIGLILAIAGPKMAKRPGITGKSVAVGGLVTALRGLILGGVVLGGLATFLNDKTQLDRIQSYLDKQQAKLPSAGEVRNSTPDQ